MDTFLHVKEPNLTRCLHKSKLVHSTSVLVLLTSIVQAQLFSYIIVDHAFDDKKLFDRNVSVVESMSKFS